MEWIITKLYLICVVLAIWIARGSTVNTDKKTLMTKPVQFISFTNGGHMKINDEAKNILRNISMKAVVVSIIGATRNGKSYFLNRLFGKNGFDVGSTQRAETKGIWIWVKEHPTKYDTVLVVLDTEGLDHTDKANSTYDLMVSTVALLSSTLIYNIKNNIQGKDLMILESVVKLSEMVGNKNKREDFNGFKPDLRMVIQSFNFYLVDKKGKRITVEMYLKELRSPQHDDSERIKDIKEAIDQYFDDINLHTLCTPVEEEKLITLDMLPEEDLKPKYVAESKKLINSILERSEVLTMVDVPLKLPVWLEIAMEFVDVLNSQDLSGIEGTPYNIKEALNRKAYSKALAAFDSDIDDLDLPIYNFELRTNEILSNALYIFEKHSFGDEESKVNFEEVLLRRIKSLAITNYKMLKMEKDCQKCRENLKPCSSKWLIALCTGPTAYLAGPWAAAICPFLTEYFEKEYFK